MNIGIIIYSFSGHTLSVAKRLKEKLTTSGHEVTLEQLETVGPKSLKTETAPLKAIPAIDIYDALIFGFPVRGGTVPQPMANYLEHVSSFRDGSEIG